MLKFLILTDGHPAEQHVLRNAHMIGSDGNAVRADIHFRDGHIVCDKREPGSAALALQKSVGDCGQLTIQTCLLPDRDERYLLNLELARRQLMVLYGMLEDWQLFDLDPQHAVMKRAMSARTKFIDGLCRQHDDAAAAEELAHRSLVEAIDGCEELALVHAHLLLQRRKTTAAIPKYPIGCGVTLDNSDDRFRAGLAANFDFVNLPISWRQLAPEETEYGWQALDQCVDWLGRAHIPAVAGPLIGFQPNVLPDWLYIWEHDFDAMRDLIYDHVERVVTRYDNSIFIWNVISGLHVNNHFTFTFDQIMDVSRMTTMLVKKKQPSAKVLIEIRQPFGEYYGANQRSIPPLMYADLLVQGAVNFDGFSLKLLMGQAHPGHYTRDLMQISGLLDRFGAFGKPISLTIAVPSTAATNDKMIETDGSDEKLDTSCGFWRRPWSPLVQSHWLEAILKIAFSKPFVDAVAWQDLIDHPDTELPGGGLIRENLQPKGALRRLIAFRKNLLDGAAPTGK